MSTSMEKPLDGHEAELAALERELDGCEARIKASPEPDPDTKPFDHLHWLQLNRDRESYRDNVLSEIRRVKQELRRDAKSV